MFDKFYTKKEVAKGCIQDLFAMFPETRDKRKLECSAGGGSFSLQLENIDSFDILPEHSSIQQADFLTLELDYKEYVTIGNPPFGKRSRLAIDFFNKATENSLLIAFIVPLTFSKYSVQKKLKDDWKLVFERVLDKFSFEKKGKSVDVNTCFQIWVKKDSFYDKKEHKDLRKKSRPKVEIDNLVIFQHNATKDSRKYLDMDWDIAFYRQGYKDYSKVFYKEKDYAFLKDRIENSSDQFFFVKCLDKGLISVIEKLDIDKLASRGVTVKGFGKSDFVEFLKGELYE